MTTHESPPQNELRNELQKVDARITSRVYRHTSGGNGGHPKDTNAPLGSFVVWNRWESSDGNGHIALVGPRYW